MKNFGNNISDCLICQTNAPPRGFANNFAKMFTKLLSRTGDQNILVVII